MCFLQKVNEKAQVINDYEAGRGIPNQMVIGKIERVLGVKLRGKDRGKPLTAPGTKKWISGGSNVYLSIFIYCSQGRTMRKTVERNATQKKHKPLPSFPLVIWILWKWVIIVFTYEIKETYFRISRIRTE